MIPDGRFSRIRFEAAAFPYVLRLPSPALLSLSCGLHPLTQSEFAHGLAITLGSGFTPGATRTLLTMIGAAYPQALR